MFRFVFVLTVVYHGCKALRSRNISAQHHENNDGYRFSGEFFESRTEGLLVCSTICISTDICITASYNAFAGRCLIFGRIFPDPALYGLVSSYVEESGWRSFRVSPCQKCPASKGYSCSRKPASCYKYYAKSGLKYAASRQRCVDDGGVMMKVDSVEKQKMVEDILDDVQYGEVWIQGERMDGTWVYDDGTEFTFSNWNTGEGWLAKNNVVIIRKTEGYKWHDAEYKQTFGVLCEIYL